MDRAAHAAPHRWIPRAAVLTSLAVATIAVPLSAAAGSGSDATEIQADAPDVLVAPRSVPVGPSAASILGAAGDGSVDPAPAILAQAVSADERTVKAASRSEDRDAIIPSGCDISTRPTGTNGQLSKDGLCELWGSGNFVRADAADALTALNNKYVAEFGKNMCITDSYRTLSSQISLKSTKGGLAATPGKSEHGWGLAVDLCSETYTKTAWMRENAPKFGWDNPPWARPGGSGATEPWHWEFTEGVLEHSR